MAGADRGTLSTLKFRTTRLVATAAAGTSRLVARHRRLRLEPGRWSVLTVNWNTADFLADLLRAVDKFSPDVDIIVVDNASKDTSRQFLRDQSVRSILLPINLGHGPALDIAVGAVRTEFFVTLDVDAFPVRADWLDSLRAYLDAGNVVAGGHMHRGFVHPSLLAMRTRDFRTRGHSFIRSHWQTGQFVHGRSWDVAERISMREPGRVALIEPSEVRGPGVIGTIYGGIAYHNWFSAQGPESHRIEARAAWAEAVARFIDADQSPDPTRDTTRPTG